MGKKKVGRRQILQLEDKKEVKHSKPLIKNLLHYSDSDEDSKKSNDSELSANVAKDICPLDSQVADFFKEIDALTVNEEVVDANEKGLHIENESLGEKKDTTELELNNDVKPIDVTVQEAGPEVNVEIYCAWQEIQDDSTGYSYYWNVETNEVTWDCPEEYSSYVNSLNRSKNDGSAIQLDKEKEARLKNLQKKKESRFKEGSIIPISYYGGSSSDESSDDGSSGTSKNEEKSTKSVKKKNENVTGFKIKTNKLIDSCMVTEEASFSGSLIGPQLPPDFHFPHDVTENGDNINSNIISETKYTKKNNSTSQNFTGKSVHKSCESICSEDGPKSTSFDNLRTEFKSNQNISSVIDKGRDKESPDSTVTKGNSKTTTYLTGRRPVVEYDSFTDEDEEVSTCDIRITKSDVTSIDPQSCISSIDPQSGISSINPQSDVSSGEELVKSHNSKDVKENISAESDVSINEVESAPIEQEFVELEKSTAMPPEKVSSLKTPFLNAKRKHTNVEESTKNVLFGIKKSKISDTEFMASGWSNMEAQIAYQNQRGLGFKEEKIEYGESEPSYSVSNDYKKSDYKSVSFVKSNNVLDLNKVNISLLDQVNIDLSNENNLDQLSEKTLSPVSVNTENNVTENLICDKTSALSSNTESEETNAVIPDHSSHVESNETNTTTLAFSSNIESKEANVIPNYSSDTEIKEESAAIPIKDEISSYDFEEDIDEIDKALCEALEAKKVADKLSKYSTEASSVLEESTSESDASNEVIPTVRDSKMLTDRTSDVAETLLDKLTFMVSVHTNLTSLSTLLIQLQTRFLDWQSGALNHDFFKVRLQEVNEYISDYESTLVSGDWICDWDSFHKRYFYLNKKTQVTRLTYPEDLIGTEASTKEVYPEASESSDNTFTVDKDKVPSVIYPSISDTQLTPDSPFEIETSEDELQTSSSNCLRETSPPPPPPGVDSPPPPPPSSPPPHSPLPLPPDSTEAAYEIPEDMDLENSNDSYSHPIISNDIAYEVNQIQFSSMGVCSSSNIENNLVENSVASVTPTVLTSYGDVNIISEGSQTFPLASNNCPPAPTSVSLSSKALKDDLENLRTFADSVYSQSESNLDLCQSPSTSLQLCSSEGVKKKVSQTNSKLAPKKEKKKTKLLPVMALKKKNIPLLVEKWQKIRKEQEKEDKSDCA